MSDTTYRIAVSRDREEIVNPDSDTPYARTVFSASVTTKDALARTLRAFAESIEDTLPQPEWPESNTHLVPKEWFETALMNESRVVTINKRIDDLWNHKKRSVRQAARYLNGSINYEKGLPYLPETSDKIYLVVILNEDDRLTPDSAWETNEEAIQRASQLKKAGHAETWGVRLYENPLEDHEHLMSPAQYGKQLSFIADRKMLTEEKYESLLEQVANIIGKQDTYPEALDMHQVSTDLVNLIANTPALKEQYKAQTGEDIHEWGKNPTP